MQLLSFNEVRRRLDPDGVLGITTAWLRTRLGYVKVGKKHVVPEAEFTAFCERLMDECRAKQPRPASSGEKTSPPGPSAGEKEAESVSTPPAQAIANRLKKRSRPGKQPASPENFGNVVSLPTRP